MAGTLLAGGKEEVGAIVTCIVCGRQLALRLTVVFGLSLSTQGQVN